MAVLRLAHHQWSRVPNRPSRRLTYFCVVVVVFLGATVYLLTTDSDSLSLLRPAVHVRRANFWQQTLATLTTDDPRANPVVLEGSCVSTLSSVPDARCDVSVSPADLATLAASHASFVSSLPKLARLLPYKARTTGIVITACADTFGQAVSAVLAARTAGSRLPIQVVLSSTAASIEAFCRSAALRSLDATCLFLPVDASWAVLRSRPVGTKWPSVAALASSFQRVLVLDADAVAARDPDGVFLAEPFASRGLVTWPDGRKSSTSPLFWRVARGSPPSSSSWNGATADGGLVAVDKASHAHTLLLALYYDFFGREYYYPLLGRKKETFLQAALALDGLNERNVPWHAYVLPDKRPGLWHVRRMPVVHASMANQSDMFLDQIDPTEDYRAATTTTTSDHPSPADRPMFFRPAVKPDFSNLADPESPVTRQGHSFVRMWGDAKWIVERTGRDVEKELWLAAAKLYCEAELKAACDSLTNFTLEPP